MVTQYVQLYTFQVEHSGMEGVCYRNMAYFYSQINTHCSHEASRVHQVLK